MVAFTFKCWILLAVQNQLRTSFEKLFVSHYLPSTKVCAVIEWRKSRQRLSSTHSLSLSPHEERLPAHSGLRSSLAGFDLLDQSAFKVTGRTNGALVHCTDYVTRMLETKKSQLLNQTLLN